MHAGAAARAGGTQGWRQGAAGGRVPVVFKGDGCCCPPSRFEFNILQCASTFCSACSVSTNLLSSISVMISCKGAVLSRAGGDDTPGHLWSRHASKWSSNQAVRQSSPAFGNSDAGDGVASHCAQAEGTTRCAALHLTSFSGPHSVAAHRE